MNTVLQIRIDDELKNQATMLYDQLGIDLSTAIRMFLKKSIAVNGIPFELKNENSENKGIAALNNMRKLAEDSNLSDMTLDEINEIINQVRKERKNL